ncbi:hypothetical protein WA171_003960 [Blastocystis sp. BT1]
MMERIRRKLSHFDFKKYLKANRSNMLLWIVMFLVIMITYHFFSDGDFSFLLTLASMTSAFGFILVLIKCYFSKSVAGISIKSMQCYAIVYALRLVAIMNSKAYLPYDASGDWLYTVVLWITLIIIVLILYLMTVPLKYTHNVHHDTWGQQYVNKKYTSLLLIVPSFILALIVRPQRSGKGFIDFCWASSMYLESVSILPQLHMFRKNRTGEIESFTSHYVFAMFLSKLMDFLFWMNSWQELNGYYGFISSHFAGITIIFFQILQLGLMSSYVFYYVRSALVDSPMVLPTSMDMRSD